MQFLGGYRAPDPRLRLQIKNCQHAPLWADVGLYNLEYAKPKSPKDPIYIGFAVAVMSVLFDGKWNEAIH